MANLRVKTSLISIDKLIGNLSPGFPQFDSLIIISEPTSDLAKIKEHILGITSQLSETAGHKIGVITKDMTKVDQALLGEVFRYAYYAPTATGEFTLQEEQLIGISSVAYDWVEPPSQRIN